MKKIPLTKGKFALVDDDDFKKLSKYSWRYHRGGRCEYARRVPLVNDSPDVANYFSMHRQILKAKCGTRIDHINGNGLDNRRSNLRYCNHSENICNRRLNINNKSGFKGVFFDKRIKKWTVSISKNRVLYRVGAYNTAHDAMIAYDAAAAVLHGKFARTNAML